MAETEVSGDMTDSPALFLCSSCRTPLGDSGDREERAESDDSILLRAVTEDVEIDEAKAVSSFEMDAFSTVQVLYCKGCSTTVGALYIATPGHLDYKRGLFNLNKKYVTCYCFSNPHKQRSRVDQKSVKLPSIPYMEAQLKKCRMVFGFCERTVTKMEDKLFHSSESLQ